MSLNVRSAFNQFRQQPGIPTFIVIIFCLLYVASILSKANGDPLKFVAYDGHYAFQIAYRLFGDQRQIPESYPYAEAIPNAYRYQRILYPLLARVLAINQPALIPWMLILLNILAISLGTWMTELLLRHYGTSHWYALVYGLYAGNIVALRSDMNEPLAQALVMMAIWAWVRFRMNWAIIWFTLALLAKETALLFMAAYGLHSLIKRNWHHVIGLSVSIIPYASYQLLLYLWFGEFGLSSGERLNWIPFGGWLQILKINPTAFLLLSIIIVPIAIVPTISGFIISLHSLWQRIFHPYAFAILFHAIFMLFLPHLTYRESSATIRVVQGLAISLLLFGALTRSRRILNYSLLWLFANVIVISGK